MRYYHLYHHPPAGRRLLTFALQSFYRKHSVPNGRTGRPRGLFSRREGAEPVQPTRPRQPPSNAAPSFPRPDLDPSRHQRSSPAPRRATPRPQAPPQSPPSRAQPYPPPRSTPPPMASPRPHHSPSSDAPPARSHSDVAHAPDQGAVPGTGNPSHPAGNPPPAASQSPPIPSLDELLAMTDEEVSHMSISALKSVLYQNHVNARLLLEKSDLVARVHALLGDERQERAREAAIHAREEEDIISRQHAMMEEQRLREERARQERDWAHIDNAHVPGNGGQQPKPKVSPPPMMGTPADLERNGLCVVCQDEEANIAIVDCGYVFTSSAHFCLHHRRIFAAIWQCADIAQILSCPHRASVHCAVPASSRKLVFSASSSHNAILLCFACIYSIVIVGPDRLLFYLLIKHFAHVPPCL
jgi:hypothetical protein